MMFLLVVFSFFWLSIVHAQNDCIFNWVASCSVTCGDGIQSYTIRFDGSNQATCKFNASAYMANRPKPQRCSMPSCPTNTGTNMVKRPCMLPARVNNPGACLDFMKQAMADPTLFRFGTNFRKICDPLPANPGNITCRPTVPPGASPFSYQTLGSHMFQDDSYNINSPYLNDLQYPLTVTYTSPSETYTGCNASVTSSKKLTIDINPNMASMGAFHYRYIPEISAPACTSTSLCTLMFFDVGNGNIHNIWVNWPKNSDLSNYGKPGYYGLTPNPYAWLVFEQSYEINNFPQRVFYPRFSVNLEAFKQQYGLKGPVGLTWLMEHCDLSSISYRRSFGLPGANICPQFLDVTLRLKKNALRKDLGISLPNKLAAWLAVCYNEEDGSQTWLNPIQNAGVPIEATRSAPDLFLYLKMFGATESDFTGRSYTLILAKKQNVYQGPLSLYRQAPFNSQNNENVTVFLHWFKINVPGNDINAGVELLPYLAPNSQGSQYYLLLYRQSQELSAGDCGFSNDCRQTEEQRCMFLLQQFVKATKLTLEAVSRFRSSKRTKNNSK